MPTAEEAEDYDYSSTERRVMNMWNAQIMSGTGAQAVEKLGAWPNYPVAGWDPDRT